MRPDRGSSAYTTSSPSLSSDKESVGVNNKAQAGKNALGATTSQAAAPRAPDCLSSMSADLGTTPRVGGARSSGMSA